MGNGGRKKTKRAIARNRALRVSARMRRGTSFTSAAREEHIDPRTVKRYLGKELKTVKGRTRISKADRKRRNMLIPTERGTTPVAIRGSRQASRLGRYMSAVGKYLRSGDTDALSKFKGKSIGGHALITDPDTLSVLAQAGALTLDEIYALPESSS